VHLLDRVLADLPAIVFWYTDAPPHHASFMLPRRHRAATFTNANHHAEQNALETRSFDWIGLCRDIASTGSTVFPITFAFANDNRVACFYAALADLTGGTCLHIRTTREMSSVIAQVTIGVVMRLAGHDHVFEEDDVVRVRLDCEDLGRLRSDRDCDGHLPDDSQCVKACARGAALLRVRGDDTVRMEELFSRDAAFRDVVYSTFEDVLSPEYVEALTHNAVFGKLWRAICRNRFDPRQARLLAKMSESLSLVTDETVRGTLRDFLESSYDESERILRACTAATTLHDHQDGYGEGFFVIDDACVTPDFPRKHTDVLEINRSCSRIVVRNLGALLRNVRWVGERRCAADSSRERGVFSRWLPLALSLDDLMSMLPHLLVPGTVLSVRASCVLALLCVQPETGTATLREPAAAHLRRKRGSAWLDFSAPENVSYDFIRLAHACSVEFGDAFFTGAEREALRHYFVLGGLLVSSNNTIRVNVAYSNRRPTTRPDYKGRCKGKCGLERSFTLLDARGVCALCLCPDYPHPPLSDPRPDVTLPSTGETASSTDIVKQSVLCECHACGVHYAVVRIQDLKVRPKCHFCRVETIAPSLKNKEDREIRCVTCDNRYLAQCPPDVVDRNAPFECAACATVARRPECASTWAPVSEPAEIDVKSYVEQNFSGMAGLLSHSSLARACNNRGEEGGGEASADAVDAFSSDASGMSEKQRHHHLNGRRVVDRPGALATLRACVQNGDREGGTCGICCETFSRTTMLEPACGRPAHRCGARVCGTCLDTWFGQAVPGRVCAPAHLTCAFCKRAPTSKTLVRHNRALLRLVRNMGSLARLTTDLDPSSLYAWCVACDRLCPVAERACCDDDPPDLVTTLRDFRCDACVLPRGGAASSTTFHTKTMACPGCGVCTQKTFGCDHMTCVCGQHWCWVCGAAGGSATEIHDHIGEMHHDDSDRILNWFDENTDEEDAY